MHQLRLWCEENNLFGASLTATLETAARASCSAGASRNSIISYPKAIYPLLPIPQPNETVAHRSVDYEDMIFHRPSCQLAVNLDITKARIYVRCATIKDPPYPTMRSSPSQYLSPILTPSYIIQTYSSMGLSHKSTLWVRQFRL